MSSYKDLFDILFSGKKIILTGHTNPDGDCIGSIMGLYNYIKERENGHRGDDKDYNVDRCSRCDNISIVVPTAYPYFLNFLDADKKILVYEESKEDADRLVEAADYVVCMDFNSLSRVDELGEAIAKSKALKLLIDHHPQPKLEEFAIAVSKPELSSTCEVVYSIIKHWQRENRSWPVPLNSAIPLYTGLVTDTNNFSNSVLPSSFIMAGELMTLGVDKEYVQSMIYGGFSEDRMRMMGYILYENMKVFPDTKSAIVIIDNDIKEKFNFKEGDSEGFVNLALGIKGVNISGLFTQSENYVKVSLRSKGDISVNRFARIYFNGGGHERAAGGRIYIPINDVENYFLNALNEFLQKA